MSESCRAVEPLLGELASGGGDPLTAQVARNHVRRCGDCALLLSDLSAAWRGLDRWETPTPPARVETAVFEAVRADLTRRSGPRLVFVSLGLGLVASLLSALLVRLRMPLGGSSLALLFCGSIWTGAYALAFHAVLSRRPAPAARAALWASAALVALSLACPMGTLVDVCHAEAGITHWLGHDQGGYFLAGLVYGIVPALVGFLAIRRQGGRRLGRLFAVVAAMLALELPLFYLQCWPFALGASLSALGGAVVGAALAGLANLPLWTRPSGRVTT